MQNNIRKKKWYRARVQADGTQRKAEQNSAKNPKIDNASAMRNQGQLLDALNEILDLKDYNSRVQKE